MQIQAKSSQETKSTKSRWEKELNSEVLFHDQENVKEAADPRRTRPYATEDPGKARCIEKPESTEGLADYRILQSRARCLTFCSKSAQDFFCNGRWKSGRNGAGLKSRPSALLISRTRRKTNLFHEYYGSNWLEAYILTNKQATVTEIDTLLQPTRCRITRACKEEAIPVWKHWKVKQSFWLIWERLKQSCLLILNTHQYFCVLQQQESLTHIFEINY